MTCALSNEETICKVQGRLRSWWPPRPSATQGGGDGIRRPKLPAYVFQLRSMLVPGARLHVHTEGAHAAPSGIPDHQIPRDQQPLHRLTMPACTTTPQWYMTPHASIFLGRSHVVGV